MNLAAENKTAAEIITVKWNTADRSVFPAIAGDIMLTGTESVKKNIPVNINTIARFNTREFTGSNDSEYAISVKFVLPVNPYNKVKPYSMTPEKILPVT